MSYSYVLLCSPCNRPHPFDKAKEINNLRAVFGERYPDPVRVVSIGPTIDQLLAAPASDEWEAYSIELCAGALTLA